MVAQKVWDDNPLANADFTILYPVLTLAQVNDLELKFLLLLRYKLTVTPSLYARYYFELRTICESETRFFSNASVTRKHMEKIEARSEALARRTKRTREKGSRSSTPDDWCTGRLAQYVVS